MDTKVSRSAVTIDAVPGKPRRRRFSPSLKQWIVDEVLTSRDSVSVIARRHDINNNQLFRWKHQYQGNAISSKTQPNLLPIQVKASHEKSDGKYTSSHIDIVFLQAGGSVCRVRCPMRYCERYWKCSRDDQFAGGYQDLAGSRGNRHAQRFRWLVGAGANGAIRKSLFRSDVRVSGTAR